MNFKYDILFQLGKVYAISRQLFPPARMKAGVALSSSSSRRGSSSLVNSFLWSCGNALKVQNLLRPGFVSEDLTAIQIGELKCLSPLRPRQSRLLSSCYVPSAPQTTPTPAPTPALLIKRTGIDKEWAEICRLCPTGEKESLLAGGRFRQIR